MVSESNTLIWLRTSENKPPHHHRLLFHTVGGDILSGLYKQDASIFSRLVTGIG